MKILKTGKTKGPGVHKGLNSKVFFGVSSTSTGALCALRTASIFFPRREIADFVPLCMAHWSENDNFWSYKKRHFPPFGRPVQVPGWMPGGPLNEPPEGQRAPIQPFSSTKVVPESPTKFPLFPLLVWRRGSPRETRERRQGAGRLILL